MSAPRVAVVGRPNVGKSTLVNRLAEGRSSIVAPVAGLTRDRLDRKTQWRGREFILADTGGLVASAHQEDVTITGKVAAKAVEAIRTADLVLFVVEAPTGVTEDDLVLVKGLRKVTAPVIVVANKVDDAADEDGLYDFYSLGLGEPLGVSALHGRGSGDLLDRIVDMLPDAAAEAVVDDIASIALVGRPNVGKSSLFNHLVGEDRSIVHHDPGTTRDSVDTIATIGGVTYRFVDTAGVRRRAKTKGVEVFSASRTRDAIMRADLAVLVVDAGEGATSQDQRIAQQVAEAGVGAIVSLNKWDLITDEYIAGVTEASMKDRLHFLGHAPLVRTSALTKRGVQRLVDQIAPVLDARKNRVSTGVLNRLVMEAQQRAPIPRSRSRNVKILYATQASVAPPTFVLFATGRPAVPWLRFLERRLRDEFDFHGNPIRLVVRERTQTRGDRPPARGPAGG